MALDVKYPVKIKQKTDSLTVRQLLDRAKQDSDRVSVYLNGSSWDDTDGAIVVIKGAELAREMVEFFERQKLITPGKGVEG